MKKTSSEFATVYENENSCLEDVLAIANQIQQKTRLTQVSTQGLQHRDPELSEVRLRKKARI